jgi:hypothetical protein
VTAVRGGNAILPGDSGVSAILAQISNIFHSQFGGKFFPTAPQPVGSLNDIDLGYAPKDIDPGDSCRNRTRDVIAGLLGECSPSH